MFRVASMPENVLTRTVATKHKVACNGDSAMLNLSRKGEGGGKIFEYIADIGGGSRGGGGQITWERRE